MTTLRLVETYRSEVHTDTQASARRVRRTEILGWRQANQIALVAASRAHAALGVDLSRSRVDVATAIGRAGVDLFWRPMPRVFGAYINEPGANPGILVNNGLHGGARRHTAAHELGHHWLEHTTSVDDGSTIDLGNEISGDVSVDYLPSERPRRWTDQEKAAEAFAVWFLMPRRVVQSALGSFGVRRPETANDVYRLSTILGTSYATTLRHLPNLRMALVKDTTRWLRIPPGRLKARLDLGVPPPADRRRDVYVVDSRAGAGESSVAEVYAEVGDRIVLPGVGLRDLDLPQWVTMLGLATGGNATDGVVLEIAALNEPRIGLVPGTKYGTLRIHAGPQPSGRH